VRVKGIECAAPAAVASTVSEYCPGGVEVDVLTLKFDMPDGVVVVGLNAALAPAGSPLTLKLTWPPKPARGATVTVKDVDAPGITLCVVGPAAIVKSALEFTVDNVALINETCDAFRLSTDSVQDTTSVLPSDAAL
jgi:hypothetical protein